MRSSKSRSRGNKNRNNRPSGGNIVNRVFDSSGPDGKVRGTPQQIIDKYNQLHRDAQLSGDRVAAENFAQHAEHYLRMLAEAQREIDKAREEQEEQNRQRQADRDRERAQRLKAQEEAAADPGSLSSQGEDGSGDSGLVETPESRSDSGSQQQPGGGGDAAAASGGEGGSETGGKEKGEAKRPRQRRSRKKADAEQAPTGGEGQGPTGEDQQRQEAAE